MPVRAEPLRHNLSVRSNAYSKQIAAYSVSSQQVLYVAGAPRG